MINNLELSELISVKLLHDLSGAIGAINNGTELLKDANNDIYDKSLELIEDSAKYAIAKILFFRQAYGSASSSSQTTLKFLKTLTDDFYHSGNVSVSWSKESVEQGSQIAVDGIFAKILLNATMMAAKTMVYGGKIQVTPKKSNNKDSCVITAKGKLIKISTEQLEILQKKEVTCKIDVKNVQFYLVRRLCETLNMDLKISAGQESLEIKIV
jgi:histidine phosphotransferase ChpT